MPAHLRTQSTDTIVHTPGREVAYTRGPVSSQSAGNMPQKIQVPEPSNQELNPEENVPFLWPRRRCVTDPDSRDSSLAAEISAPAATIGVACGSPESPWDGAHFMDVAIPDHHLHLLTPECAERAKDPLVPTDVSTTPSTSPGLPQDETGIIRRPVSAATATSYPSRLKRLTRKRARSRLRALPGRPALDRVFASRVKETAAPALEFSCRGLDCLLTCDHHAPLNKGERMEVLPPKEEQHLRMSLGLGIASRVNLLTNYQDPAHIPSLKLRDIDLNETDHQRHNRCDSAESPSVEAAADSGKEAEPSHHTSRSLLPGQASGHRPVRRFAFIPTTTTTGCDHNQPEQKPQGTQGASDLIPISHAKNIAPTLPARDLSESLQSEVEHEPDPLIVETSSDDLASLRSLPPPPPPPKDGDLLEEEVGLERNGYMVANSNLRRQQLSSRRALQRNGSLKSAPAAPDPEENQGPLIDTTSMLPHSASPVRVSEIDTESLPGTEEGEVPFPPLTRMPRQRMRFLEESPPGDAVQRDGSLERVLATGETPQYLSAERMTLRMVSPPLSTGASEDNEDTTNTTISRGRTRERDPYRHKGKSERAEDGRHRSGLVVIPIVMQDTSLALHPQKSDDRNGANKENAGQNASTAIEVEQRTSSDGVLSEIIDVFPAPPSAKAERELQSVLRRKLYNEIRNQKHEQGMLRRQTMPPSPLDLPPPSLQLLSPGLRTSQESEGQEQGHGESLAITGNVLQHQPPRQRRGGSQKQQEAATNPSRPSPPLRFPPRVTDPPETPWQPPQQLAGSQQQTQVEGGREGNTSKGVRSWLPSLPTCLPLPSVSFRQRHAPDSTAAPAIASEARQLLLDQRQRTVRVEQTVVDTDTISGLPEHSPDAIKAARHATIQHRERETARIAVSTNTIRAATTAGTAHFMALLACTLKAIVNLVRAILYAWWVFSRPVFVSWISGNGMLRRRYAGRTTVADIATFVAAVLLCAAALVGGRYVFMFLAWIGLF